MIYKWIEDCKNNIARLKKELRQAKTEEERETIADKIADEQQALEGYKGAVAAIEWEADFLNGEL